MSTNAAPDAAFFMRAACVTTRGRSVAADKPPGAKPKGADLIQIT